ncbi:MAG: hypothetical protein U0359_32390 [Byssovorax sp.]
MKHPLKLLDHGASRRRLDALIASMAAREKPVRIVQKRAFWHQRAAGHALFALTFGGQRTYLSHYVTTLGHTIYVPDGFDRWDPSKAYRVLRHELVHVAQFERWGMLGMVLIYGFFPLPAGLAWGRARLEWEAYKETLRVVAQTEGLAAAHDPALHAQIVRRFTGPDYGWMWPFPAMVRRWIRAALDEIERELDPASI